MKRYHQRYYFGGIALILLVLQVLSGIFLTMFYEPDLGKAYGSVQYLYNDLFTKGWVRDSHRWTAFFVITAVIIHFIRSLLRKDFLRPRKRISWLTGMLLIFFVFTILVTGFILPWEWKGYWFMEMVPNMAGEIPLIGESLKGWLLSFFTLNRAFVSHILLLPTICIVLVDIHVFGSLRIRKGGIPGYLMRHGLITLPIVLVILVLAVGVQMPTEDPDIIPLPLEGRYIPTAEWYALVFFAPFMYFENWIAPTLGLYIPLVVFLALTLLPFFLKRKPLAARKTSRLSPAMKKVAAFAAVTCTASILFSSVYTVSYRSPTLGCNSCHNVYMGNRMGIPPAEFRDREKLPLLDDNRWMVEHWFEPQQTW
jgi:quinol-cytochrome oxidoreductase complex cytochrome b subunit